MALSLVASAQAKRWPDPPRWWLYGSQMTCVRYRESSNGAGSRNIYQMTNPGGWSEAGGSGWAGNASRAEQDYRAWRLWNMAGCHQPWGIYDGCC